MSTHLNQYVAACRLQDDLRAAEAARAMPRAARRKRSPLWITRLRSPRGARHAARA